MSSCHVCGRGATLRGPEGDQLLLCNGCGEECWCCECSMAGGPLPAFAEEENECPDCGQFDNPCCPTCGEGPGSEACAEETAHWIDEQGVERKH